MRAVALAAPLLALAVLHLLYMMEVWVLEEPRTTPGGPSEGSRRV